MYYLFVDKKGHSMNGDRESLESFQKRFELDGVIVEHEDGKDLSDLYLDENGNVQEIEYPVADNTQIRLEQLDSEYQQNKDELAKYYLEAVIAGDTDLQESLKEEMSSLNETYDAEREVIENGTEN